MDLSTGDLVQLLDHGGTFMAKQQEGFGTPSWIEWSVPDIDNENPVTIMPCFFVMGWGCGGYLTYLATLCNGLCGLGWQFRGSVFGAAITGWDTPVITSSMGYRFANMSGRAPWKYDPDAPPLPSEGDAEKRYRFNQHERVAPSPLWEFGSVWTPHSPSVGLSRQGGHTRSCITSGGHAAGVVMCIMARNDDNVPLAKVITSSRGSASSTRCGALCILWSGRWTSTSTN